MMDEFSAATENSSSMRQARHYVTALALATGTGTGTIVKESFLMPESPILQ